MKLSRSPVILGLAISCSLLTGCGGSAPTAEEAQEAMMNAIPGLSGMKNQKMLSMAVNEVKDCEETNNVYLCTVDVTTKAFGITQNTVQQTKFSKNKKGVWVVVM